MGPRPSVRGPDAGYAGYPRPAGAAVGALATAWRGEPATTRSVIESFAAGASQEVKAELTRIPWMLRRFREPWDAADEATNEALDFLVHRAGGDWGHEAAHHAVDALESMAEDVPAVAQQVDALIGHILALCSPEPDAVIRPAADPMARQIEAMERESRRIRRNARRRDLAKTVGQSAAFDPERVLRSVLPLFTASAGDETYDRAVRTTMIDALEEAASPETVRDLLPVVYSALLDGDQVVRSAGVDLWAACASVADTRTPGIPNRIEVPLLKPVASLVFRRSPPTPRDASGTGWPRDGGSPVCCCGTTSRFGPLTLAPG